MTAPNEYLTMTEPKEVIDRHIGRYDTAIHYLEDLLGLRKGTWYDAGCGIGYGTKKMPGTWNIGFDINEKAIRQANMTSTVPGTVFHNMGMSDIETLLRPGILRAILCIHSYEHMHPQEQYHALCTFWRMLEPGGALWLCCPVVEEFDAFANPYHISTPTIEGIKSGLKLAGFITDAAVQVLGTTDYKATSGEMETEVRILARKL